MSKFFFFFKDYIKIFETKSAAYSLFVTPVFFTFKMNKKTYHNISEKNSDVIYRSIDVIPP